MIDSAISTGHQYYLQIFTCDYQVETLLSFLCDSESEYTEVECKNNVVLYHGQNVIPNLLGSFKLLSKNKSIKKHTFGDAYWYDFYLGFFEFEATKYYFLAYPYKVLEYHYQSNFFSKFTSGFHSPSVENILNYIELLISVESDDEPAELVIRRKKAENLSFPYQCVVVNYKAEVSDDVHADSISINGNNPISSKIYIHLKETYRITATSLRVRFSLDEIAEIETSFDKEGRISFYIPANRDGDEKLEDDETLEIDEKSENDKTQEVIEKSENDKTRLIQDIRFSSVPLILGYFKQIDNVVNG